MIDTRRTIAAIGAGLGIVGLVIAGPVLAQEGGKPVYDKACVVCHGSGVAGAPRFGNAQDWSARITKGKAALYKVALEGNLKGMPPRGGRSDLSDAEVRAAVDYMVAAAGPSSPAPAVPAATVAPPKAAAAPKDKQAAPTAAAAPAAPVPRSASATAPGAGASTPATPAGGATAGARADTAAPAAATPATPTTAATPATPPLALVTPPTPGGGPGGTSGDAAAEVNAFNRLLRPVGKRNAPPTEDGIHDPANDGTAQLQPPLTAFAKLPRANAGNRINWVAALAENKIQPRWDRSDPKAQAVVMDMNIVREVKGSMPDVLYPHKQHTEWLDCSNCHPAIFVPQKGANQISMASILLGQKCGVCHGKVAFPVSECRLCHSQKKETVAAQKTEGKR